MNELKVELFLYYMKPPPLKESCLFLCCSNCLRKKDWYARLKKFLWSEWDGVDDDVDHLELSPARNGTEDTNPQYSQYDDFQTIDWPRELARDRARHRFVQNRRNGRLKTVWDACSAWLCVFLVGGACGAIAAVIDIGTGWLSNLKEGSCGIAFWLNKEQCCWSSNSSFYEGDECEEWMPWSSQLGYVNSSGAFYVEYVLYVSWALMFSMLAALLVRTFAPYAAGGGIPEIKTVLSGYIIRGLLGKWTLIIKTVGVMLAVAAGLVLGKEGPLVHIACCIGNIVSYFFAKYGKNEAKKREILSAASAAGVSVAFGAPIGGVLFSLEEVSYYFPLKTLWRTFFCALVASFTLTSINPFGNDHLIVFYVDYKTPWVLFELLPFALLGILGGLLGSLFIKANVYVCRLRKTSILGKYPLVEIAAITVLTALLSFPMKYTRIDTSELIGMLVRNCKVGEFTDLCSDYSHTTFLTERSEAGEGIYRALWQLALTLVIKFVLLILTAGIKLPAGLYIPSLAIGAIFGRMVGMGMEQLAIIYPDIGIFQGECSPECVTPGLYAMVGAAAMLGGVTRMTVGLVVIIFEVTGSVRYIVPVMTAVMFSKWAGDSFCKRGIFESLIELNDYPFLDIKEEFDQITFAADVMNPRNKKPLIVLYQIMTFETIENILSEYNFNGFPVVVSQESQYLIGFVLRKDLFASLKNAKSKFNNLCAETEVTFTECNGRERDESLILDFTKIVDEATVTITIRTPMESVVEMFKKLGLRQLLVAHKGRLLGIITKKDVTHHVKNCSHLNAAVAETTV